MSVIDASKIKYIVVHCSATKEEQDIGAEDINSWHISRGWSEIGYHLVIRRDGTIEFGRDFDKVGAHIKGFNHGSWGICLVGGIDESGNSDDNFTQAQWKSFALTIQFLRKIAPQAIVRGHRDFPDVHKDCPSFDVTQKLWEMGL